MALQSLNSTPLSKGALAATGLVAAVAVAVWAYWTTLAGAAQRWAHDPQYSHGYLVPGFAVLLLWLRRGRLDLDRVGPSWWGVPLLAFGIGLRLFGTYYYYLWLDSISFIPCLLGLFLTLGGWAAIRWAWPSLLFLAFMIPLPHRLSVAMADPLQRIATIASTFCLQTLGLPAVAEGKTILINDATIGIVEACSGLRMLVIFFALSTAVALVIKRPLWEKLLIAFSAVPIALISNVARITVTGFLHEMVSGEVANAVFHDLAGWLMMPLALGMLGLELHLLGRLFLAPGTPTLPTHVAPLPPRPTSGPLPPPAAPRRPRRRGTAASQPYVPFGARPTTQS